MAICRTRHIALNVARRNMLRSGAGRVDGVEIGLGGATYFSLRLEAFEERE